MGETVVARLCARVRLAPRPARFRALPGRGPSAPPVCFETRPVPGRPCWASWAPSLVGLAVPTPLSPLARAYISTTVTGHTWGHPPGSPLGPGGSVLRVSSGSRLSPGTAPLHRASGLATTGHKAWSDLGVRTPGRRLASCHSGHEFSSDPQYLSYSTS